MSIPCFIVDDQRHGIADVATQIKKFPELRLVGTETDSYTALNKIMSGAIKVDILFLDIEMPDISGTDFCEHIGDRAVVIFVTGYTDFALEAFKLGAIDYIMKPIKSIDFLNAIQKAKDKLIAREKLAVYGQEDKFIFLKLSPRHVIKQKLKDLIYVSVDDKYISLHAGAPKPLTIQKSLSDMEAILPRDMFLRVHKSHIVNLAYIDSIVGNRINMTGNFVLEIGSSYMSSVYSRFDSI